MIQMDGMKIQFKEMKLVRPILVLLLVTFSCASFYMWDVRNTVDNNFLYMTIRAGGILLLVSFVYFSLTFEDKSKTAKPWLNSVGVLMSLLLDIAIMLGSSSVLGKLVGLETNKIFILTLFAIIIYLLMIRSLFQDNKLSWILIIPFLVASIAGDESYRWYAVVILIGLSIDEIFGDYVKESTVVFLEKISNGLNKKKPIKKKSKKRKKKGLLKRTKTRRKKKK